jgi:hypothetical protein
MKRAESGFVMVKVAVPETDGVVPVYVAVTTGSSNKSAFVIVAGTVSSPVVESIVQPFEIDLESSDQTTAAPLTPVTLALNCCVPPNMTAGSEGVTITFTFGAAAQAKSTKPPIAKAQTKTNANTATLEALMFFSLICSMELHSIE